MNTSSRRTNHILIHSGLPLQFYALLDRLGAEGILDFYGLLRKRDAITYVESFIIPPKMKDITDETSLLKLASQRKLSHGLFLHGHSNKGKTVLASWILYSLIKREKDPVQSVMFANVAEWLDKLRPGRDEDTDWLERAKDVDLLVLDDIGTEVLSQWVFERLYLIVNYRRDSLLPTIYVSNLSLDDIENRFKERDEVGAMRLITRFINTCQVWSFGN